MITVEHPARDAGLQAALLRVIRLLRARQYDLVKDSLWSGLLRASDAFVDRLAEHLHEEESILFPALRRAAPQREAAIAALLSEHAEIRAQTQDLAVRISEGDNAQAVEDVQRLHETISAHMAREGELIDATVRALDRDTLSLLMKRLFHARLKSAERELALAFPSGDVSVRLRAGADASVTARLRSPRPHRQDAAAVRSKVARFLRDKIAGLRKVKVIYEAAGRR